jgi:hypothetical protein
MSVSEYLRHHSTVVRDRERKGLVSVGAAFRRRKSREAAAHERERNRERYRACANDPNNPSLSEKRRAEIRARQDMAEQS